ALLYIPIFKQMHGLADVRDKVALSAPLVTESKGVNADDEPVIIRTTETMYENGNRFVETVTTTDNGAAEPKVSVRSEIFVSATNFWWMAALVFIQVIFVAMVYGPIAAFLVELFPTRIRYTSMSLPYHIGNGIFGGLTPYIATSLYVASQTPANPEGNPFAGLYYPMAVAGITFVIGMIFLSNRPKGEVMN